MDGEPGTVIGSPKRSSYIIELDSGECVRRMESTIEGIDDAPPSFAPAHGSALVGRCGRCGRVNAVDLDDTPENRRNMEMPGRVITVVGHDTAIKLFATAGRCDCGKQNGPVPCTHCGGTGWEP